MKRKLLFIQPIVSHYRKSVIDEIIKLEPNSFFWGASDFEGVLPLESNRNIDNTFKVRAIRVFGVKFFWYKRLILKFLKDDSSHIVISGINPLLIQSILIFILARWFTSKKVYWWSQGKKFKQGFIGKWLRYIFYRYSNGIFLYSNEGKNNFLKEGLPEDKLYVINNSLNFDDYDWLNYPIRKKIKSDFRIIYTGRLSKRKKINVLLKAFKILIDSGQKGIYIDIIGDGDQKENLLNYARDKNIDKFVFFHGAQYGKRVHKYFLNGDIVVCPGAVGLYIVHALSFGLPFITGKGDPSHSSELELLDVGKNGDYFLLDDFKSLARTILIWKNKFDKNIDNYRENCTRSVIKHEYLPNLVAQKLIHSL